MVGKKRRELSPAKNSPERAGCKSTDEVLADPARSPFPPQTASEPLVTFTYKGRVSLEPKYPLGVLESNFPQRHRRESRQQPLTVDR